MAGELTATPTDTRWMGVGHSTLPETSDAAREAVTAALRNPRIDSPDDALRGDAKLVMVFASNRHDLPTLLASINDVAGDTPVVGCSTGGEIGTAGPSAGGIVVTALGGTGLSIGTAMARDIGKGGRAAGAAIAGCLEDVRDRSHRALVLLVDGSTQVQEEVVRGVYGVVGASVPLVGGCAGEETHVRPTTELYGEEVLHDAAIAVAIGSDAPLGIGISHGWRKVGDPMVVTASNGAWVSTLDDRPALDAYLDRLGAPHDVYVGFESFEPYAVTRPLGIRRRSGDEVRGVTGHTDFESRALHCGGEITQGSLIWCMDGDAQSMLDATDAACAEALESIGGARPVGLLAFDCSARRRVLGADGTQEEVRRLATAAAGAPVSGFYSFGEIARTRGINGFHHQTLVVLAVA